MRFALYFPDLTREDNRAIKEELDQLHHVFMETSWVMSIMSAQFNSVSFHPAALSFTKFILKTHLVFPMGSLAWASPVWELQGGIGKHKDMTRVFLASLVPS